MVLEVYGNEYITNKPGQNILVREFDERVRKTYWRKAWIISSTESAIEATLDEFPINNFPISESEARFQKNQGYKRVAIYRKTYFDLDGVRGYDANLEDTEYIRR